MALSQTRVPRIEPHEVHQRMQAGERVYLLDVRRCPNEMHIKGSLRFEPEEMLSAEHVILPIPKDTLVVTFCSWCNEATSERVALKLRQMGYENVHALKGGFDAWREAKLPLDSRQSQQTICI
jgi:rhodanese-related sulfurtransferase